MLLVQVLSVLKQHVQKPETTTLTVTGALKHGNEGLLILRRNVIISHLPSDER
jgi:hypothetical protein